MTTALDGLATFIGTAAGATLATFTVYVGPRQSPETGTGKTAGRFCFLGNPDGRLTATGASRKLQRIEGTIAVAFLVPYSAPDGAADYHVAYTALAELWAALMATTPAGVFTGGGKTFEITTEASYRRGVSRPVWSEKRDHGAVEGRFDIVEIT